MRDNYWIERARDWGEMHKEDLGDAVKCTVPFFILSLVCSMMAGCAAYLGQWWPLTGFSTGSVLCIFSIHYWSHQFYQLAKRSLEGRQRCLQFHAENNIV
jgi:hypothetical protein